MTSPAVCVLFVAFVCSTFSTALQHIDDYELKPEIENINMNIKTTNSFYINSSQNNKLDKRADTHSVTNKKDNNVNDLELSFRKMINSNNNNYLNGVKLKNTENFDKDEKTTTKSENIFIVRNTTSSYVNRPENNVKFILNKNTEKESLGFGESIHNIVYNKKMRQYNEEVSKTKMNRYTNVPKKRVKRADDLCEGFIWNEGVTTLHSPRGNASNFYARDANCDTVIRAKAGQRIDLTFINEFHIEEHPNCEYDYVQIRDGEFGYARSLGKFCGNVFPQVIHSSGPIVWLKFFSDSTIEYAGFTIQIKYVDDARSKSIPKACMKELHVTTSEMIDWTVMEPECKKFIDESDTHGYDLVWNITTPENTKIYLNFTQYHLAKPNECEANYVQIFGSILEEEQALAEYCGSMANSINSPDNIMYVRLFTTRGAMAETKVNATITVYRQLNTANNKDGVDSCDPDTEFDCEDNTCIDISLHCNGYANCRLKTDEDCKQEAALKIREPQILIILVIFSLILSGMSFVFLFKCIRKLYQDYKIIKEHIRQSCEDRLDDLLSDSRFPLDAKKLQRDSEPRDNSRVSLERENHTNEMYKKQRSFSQRKQTSIDSDFIQETQLDLDEEPWKREVDSMPIEAQDIRIERNGRTRTDMSKREESIRSKITEESKEKDRERERKEIRDVSVGAPDTKESGCQTRESLFQADTAPSSLGSNETSSRGFSTFGYSGATIVRPSPPAPMVSSVTLELLRQVPQQDPVKSQKKIPERRPMSAETTRSAPDVIIVSKPFR